jgi:hypothetical protein
MTALIPPEFVNITATSLQLARRLIGLAGALLDGDIPPFIGRQLAKNLDRYSDKMRRIDALRSAAALINPEYKSYPWATAQAMEEVIRHFKSAGLELVLRGDRPATQLETELIILLQVRGPNSAERLFYALKELT